MKAKESIEGTPSIDEEAQTAAAEEEEKSGQLLNCDAAYHLRPRRCASPLNGEN